MMRTKTGFGLKPPLIRQHYTSAAVVEEARQLAGPAWNLRVVFHELTFPSLELNMWQALADLHLCKLCGHMVKSLDGDGITKSHFIPSSILAFYGLKDTFLASDFTGARNNRSDDGAWTYKGFCQSTDRVGCEAHMSKLENLILLCLRSNTAAATDQKWYRFAVLLVWRSLLAHATMEHFEADHRPFWEEVRRAMRALLHAHNVNDLNHNVNDPNCVWLQQNLHFHAWLDEEAQPDAVASFLAEHTLRYKSATINTLPLTPLVKDPNTPGNPQHLCRDFSSLEVQCGRLHIIASRFQANETAVVPFQASREDIICGHCFKATAVISNATKAVRPLHALPVRETRFWQRASWHRLSIACSSGSSPTPYVTTCSPTAAALVDRLLTRPLSLSLLSLSQTGRRFFSFKCGASFSATGTKWPPWSPPLVKCAT